MTILRQSKPGDWAPVMQRAAAELAALIALPGTGAATNALPTAA